LASYGNGHTRGSQLIGTREASQTRPTIPTLVASALSANARGTDVSADATRRHRRATDHRQPVARRGPCATIRAVAR
jgi:hypothetical protein